MQQNNIKDLPLIIKYFILTKYLVTIRINY